MPMTPHYQSKLYCAWTNIIQRCENKRHPQYHCYGGRGITIAKIWRHDFLAFKMDVGECPAPGLSLDRINNDGNYEPGNIRWASRTVQGRNRRTTLFVTVKGETLALKDAVEKYGGNYWTIIARINHGQSPELALRVFQAGDAVR